MNFLKTNKLLLLILPLILTSCSNDKKGSDTPDPGYDFTPRGVYIGTMKIQRGDDSFEAVLTDQLIFIEETSSENTIQLTLKDFMVNDVEYGNVAMPAVYEKKKDGDYNLDGYAGNVPIELIGETTLSLIGTVTSEHELSFDVEGVTEGSSEILRVNYVGFKTDIVLKDYFFNFENWGVANPYAPQHLQYSLPISSEIGFSWSSTDAEVSRYMGLRLINQFTVGSNSEGWGDRLSVQIRTVEAQRAIDEMLFPKIYSGLFYLGTFKDEVTPPHAGIYLGVPFEDEPLSVKGGFKYKPGEVYYECVDITSPSEVIARPDKKDACLIEAFLYKVNSATSQSDILNLDNIRESDQVVASGSFTSDKAVSSFEEFEFNFKWKDGVSFDADQSYRIVILATSSKDGQTYSGAPGSTLLIDNLRISTKR